MNKWTIRLSRIGGANEAQSFSITFVGNPEALAVTR